MNKKYIVNLLFFLWFSFCSSQISYLKKVDSLLLVVKKQKDIVNQVKTYASICDILDQVNFDKFKKYNTLIFNLSQKKSYTIGLAIYDLNRCYLFYLEKNYSKASWCALKAKNIFFSTRYKNNYCRNLYIKSVATLAQISLMNNDFQNTKKIINNNYEFVFKSKDNENLGNLNSLMAEAYQYQDSLPQALQYGKKAFFYYRKAKSKNIIIVYNLMSTIYTDSGLYLDALTYNNLCITKTNSKLGKHEYQVDHVNLLTKLGLYQQSELIALQNKIFFKKNNLQNNIFAIYNNYYLAENYFYLKKYSKAIKILNKTVINPKSDELLTVSSLICLSKIYLKLNKNTDAKHAIDSALTIKLDAKLQKENSSLYEAKANVEQALCNYQLALLFYKKQNFINETLNKKNNNQKSLQLQTDFDITIKNNRINELEVDELKKDLKNEEQKDYLIYSLFALLIVFVALIVFIKNNQIIKRKNAIIELKNNALITSEQIIQKALEEKEVLLKEMHHRVKNNLQLVMSLLRIQAQEFNNNINDFIEITQTRIISIALIHENLYKSDDLSQVNFKEYVDNLIQSIQITYGSLNKNITLTTVVDAIYFNIQTAIPLGLIINELVINAFKHAFDLDQNGTITLQLVQNQDEYKLTISDNGKGIQELENLKKTLGISLVKQLVYQMNGVLQIQNFLGLKYSLKLFFYQLYHLME